ncbi:MAG: hypothetical protein UZ14_CFX002001162 [Chloroflexi bacterium OLB14]|nr:MAG: hypothetical protein UZ14_CFX002001162 [Chloroflexi bacterium OLB14]
MFLSVVKRVRNCITRTRKKVGLYEMAFADFVTAITSVLSLTFPFSSTLDLSLGQLIAWTTILGVGVSFGTRLIRG